MTNRQTLHSFWSVAILIAWAGVLAPDSPAWAQEPSQSDAEVSRLQVQVARLPSGSLPPNVEVHFSGKIGAKRINQTIALDEAGFASVEYDANAEVSFLWFTARAPGFVAVHYSWRNDQGPPKLPDLQPIELEPATTLSGRIVNEQGEPIAGARIEFSMPITWPKLDNYVFDLGTELTDEDGKWKFDSAPQDVSRLSIRAEHPEYLRSFLQVSKDLNTTTLKRGPSIVGRVLDAKGEPVAAARVLFGNDRFGTDAPTTFTDPQGNFKLLNCKTGHAAVTVESEGYAPQFQMVEVIDGESQKEVDHDFRLEPGHTLKIKVVDSRGNPLDGVIVVSDTWQNLRTLNFRTTTGPDGTAQWNNAPADTVLFDLLKEDYMAARRTPLVAGAEEHVVTLHPELVISGRVLNAETKKNVETFQVIRGQRQDNRNEIYWRRSEVETYTEGKYSYRIDEPMLGWILEISADGFRSVQSREFTSDEGNATFNVLLEPATGPSGIVVDSQGKSVAGADVVLASDQKRAEFRLGFYDSRGSTADHKISGESGRFTFPPQVEERYVIVAVHESGIAVVSNTQMGENLRLQLKPWGRVAGLMRTGSQADADARVSFNSQHPAAEPSFARSLNFNYQSQADTEGRFAFERVPPGPGSASRIIVLEDGDMTIHAYSSQTPVDVISGQTSQVTIGGEGRLVKGRFLLDGQPPDDVRWKFETQVSLEKMDPKTGGRDALFRREVGRVSKTGEFTVRDVPPGEYQVWQRVNAIAANGRQGGELGRTSFQISIPAGDRADEAFDVGDLTIELLDTLEPGEIAPDFVAETSTGGVLRLSELRGKLIVLNFWSTYNTVSCAENASWASVLKEGFSDDPRLVFIGLATDESREQMLETLANVQWPWTHAFVGPQWASVASRYFVQTLPANFIVGPNGLVLRKNVPPEQLSTILSELLLDKQLFEPASQPLPSRYPVERFEQTQATTELSAAPPAVLLLLDSDPTYDTSVPHHDNFIAYDIDGNELWRKNSFNVAGSTAQRQVVSDASRDRIYCVENVGDKLWAFDSSGRSVWCVTGLEADCVMVDRKTGNIWCSGGQGLEFGETAIFSPDGEELAALPFRALDMAYDPVSDAFWLVGYQLLKVSRDGALLLREKVAGWCATSVSVNPHDGRVWIVERRHSDLADSHNRLWLRSADGKVLQTISLPDDRAPMDIEWLSDQAGLLADYKFGLSQASVDGELSPTIEKKIRAFAATLHSAQSWISTPTNLLRIVDGQAVVDVTFSETECSSSLSVYE